MQLNGLEQPSGIFITTNNGLRLHVSCMYLMTPKADFLSWIVSNSYISSSIEWCVLFSEEMIRLLINLLLFS
jgi:hypothetical protein